jgi:putative transcriptional regulator
MNSRVPRLTPAWLQLPRLGMMRSEFAQALHLPITTLRDWEQRRSSPDAPARALLLAIERDPR